MVPRIRPEEVQEKLHAGGDLLLVCAYDSQEKFQQFQLEGAIPLSEFKAMEGSIAKEREIVFYCD
jgi:hypothetical protein